MARYGSCRVLRLVRDFGCPSCMPLDVAGQRSGNAGRGVDICGSEDCPEWEPLYAPSSPRPADRDAQTTAIMQCYARS